MTAEPSAPDSSAAMVAGSWSLGLLAVDRGQDIARPEPDDRGRAVPHHGAHLDQCAALPERQAQAGPPGPARRSSPASTGGT